MKAAIYCRLSEEDRNKQSKTDDSESIQNQKSMLIQYAEEKNWEVYGIYSDDDYAGSDRKRPEFNRLLNDAAQHKFDIILCKTQSRFTRELELVEKYIHGLFPVWGIRFVSVVDNADTDNKGNKKSRQINGLVNEWYLEDMSDNIKSVLDSKRRNGLHIGSFALYGYMKDPEKKGHLVIDEDAASVVREVFRLFSEGYGKTAIARILNDRGIPNPTEYKRRRGINYKPSSGKGGTLWKYYSIASMLKNEIYIGNMVQGRYGSVSYKTKQNKPRPRDKWYVVENTHEPIISRELWDRVQDMLKEKTKPFSSGKVGVFAGKVRCAECGYTMRSVKSHGNYYLQCASRFVSKSACSGAFISVRKLGNTVVEEFNKISGEYLDADALAAGAACDDVSQRRKRIASDMAAYKRKSEEFSKGLRDAYMDKVRGVISEKDFSVLSAEISAERDRFAEMAAECAAKLEKLSSENAGENAREDIVRKYANLTEPSRACVQTLIDFISVGHKQGNDIPIEIHWNF